MITPGCKFTGEVVEAIAFFICQRLSSRKYEHVKFYVSGANVAGEGELKIMKYIKSMSETARQSDEFCLVGSDADLVLLAIASKVHHVSILNALSATSHKLVASLPTLPPRADRRDGHDDRKKGGNNASRKPNRDIFVEIEIDKLSREFSHLLPNANAEDVGTDFVALGILSGNDYLPKVPFYFLDQYWNHYLRARKSQAWSQSTLVDPLTGRLNLDFLSFLLANSVNRPMAAPPVHHHRKLLRLRQLRADMASGAIDVEEIRKKYAAVTDEADEDAEGMSGISEETRKEMLQLMDDLEADGGAKMDEEADDFEDDVDGAIATTQAPAAPRPINEAATTKATEPNKNGQQQQQQRDPVDVFLDHASKDTWKDYDVNDHTSQYIYGLEWVIQSYLKGESISYDWFFPYSSAPGPKEIREWILKTKTNPNLIMSLPTHTSATMTVDGNSASAAAPSASAVPTPSKRPSNIPPEPWMFAMMLLDSTTYNYLSSAIPTHTVQPGSYVHEVHDPSYFFGYIDSPKMEEELTRMDVSAMTLEDRNFSNLGHIAMFERSYDRGSRDSRDNYVPKSPFGETEKFFSSMLFKRTAIPDLAYHHQQAPPRNRGNQGQGNRNQGNRNDSRYQSQHGARLQQTGSAPSHQNQPSQPRNNQNNQQQGQQGHQQAHYGGGVRGGKQSHTGSHQTGNQQSQYGNQQSQQGNQQPQHGNQQSRNQTSKHQHSGGPQSSAGSDQQRRNMSTNANQPRNHGAGKRDARGHQKGDVPSSTDSRMQLDETAPHAAHNAQSGQKVDLGSLFVGQGPSQVPTFAPPSFPTNTMPTAPFFDPLLSAGFQPLYPAGISQTAPLLTPNFNQPFFPPPFSMAPTTAQAPMPFPPQAFSQPSQPMPFVFPPASNPSSSSASNTNPFI